MVPVPPRLRMVADAASVSWPCATTASTNELVRQGKKAGAGLRLNARQQSSHTNGQLDVKAFDTALCCWTFDEALRSTRAGRRCEIPQRSSMAIVRITARYLAAKRREFITLAQRRGSRVAAGAGAQQPMKLRTIGFLGATTAPVQKKWTDAFVQRLHELDWIEGRSIAIEYRWAEGRTDRVCDVLGCA